MGLFGSDDNSEADDLAKQQFEQNQAELERKKQDLYKTRLDIIKGQGGQQWSPDLLGGNRGAKGFGPDASPYPENIQNLVKQFGGDTKRR
jgi:hypothetical protein